ncbi:MAG: squalene/phytoene synthase family protein [Acidobacteriota bacterium]|nr:squalene/phytoene synthase family protein [Acidobacteriota bacterium]
MRDLPRDLRRGVCFLPLDELAAVGLQPGDLLRGDWVAPLAPVLERYGRRARCGLVAGLALAARIPVRSWSVRIATALPAVLGLRTLERLEGHPRRLDPAARIRISRRSVRWEMLRTAFLCLLPKGPRLLV